MSQELWSANLANIDTMAVNAPNLILGGGFEAAAASKKQLVAPDSVENLFGFGGPSIHPMTALSAPFGMSANYSYKCGWDDVSGFYKVAIGEGDNTSLLPRMLLPCAAVVDYQMLGNNEDFILQFKQKFHEEGQYSVTFVLFGGWLRKCVTYDSTDFPDGNVVIRINIPNTIRDEVDELDWNPDSSPLYHDGLTIFINGNFNPSGNTVTDEFTKNGFPLSIGHSADVKPRYLYVRDIDFHWGSSPRKYQKVNVALLENQLKRYTREVRSLTKGVVVDRKLRLPPHPLMIRRRTGTPAVVESMQRPIPVPAREIVPEIAIVEHPATLASSADPTIPSIFTCSAISTYTDELTYTWYDSRDTVIKIETGTSSTLVYKPANYLDLKSLTYVYVKVSCEDASVQPVRSAPAGISFNPEVIPEISSNIKLPVREIERIIPRNVPFNQTQWVQVSHRGAFDGMDLEEGVCQSQTPLWYSHPPLDGLRNSKEYPWICKIELKSKEADYWLLDLYIPDIRVDLSDAVISEFGIYPCASGVHVSKPTTFVSSRLDDTLTYQIITVKQPSSDSYITKGAVHYMCIRVNNAYSPRVKLIK